MEDVNKKVNDTKEAINAIILSLKDSEDGSRELQIRNMLEGMLFDEAFTMDQDEFNDRYSSDDYYDSSC